MATANTNPPANDDATSPENTETPGLEFPAFLGVPAGIGVPTESDLGDIVGKAASLERAFDKLIGEHQEHLARKRQELDRVAANATWGLDSTISSATRAVVTKAAEQKANKEYDLFAQGVRTLTQEARDEMLRQLDALDRRAQVVLKLFPSPVQLLAVAGLGSAERTAFHAQVSHAGSAELATLANYALATNNTLLASALLARLDHLPKSMPKPFHALQLAEAMVGERHRALVKAAKTVAATFQRIVNQNRDFERGKVNLVAKVQDALTLRQLNDE